MTIRVGSYVSIRVHGGEDERGRVFRLYSQYPRTDGRLKCVRRYGPKPMRFVNEPWCRVLTGNDADGTSAAIDAPVSQLTEIQPFYMNHSLEEIYLPSTEFNIVLGSMGSMNEAAQNSAESFRTFIRTATADLHF